MAMRPAALPIFIFALILFFFSSCRSNQSVEVCFLRIGKPTKCSSDPSEIEKLMADSGEEEGFVCMNPEDLRRVFKEIDERCSPAGMRNRAESEPQ